MAAPRHIWNSYGDWVLTLVDQHIWDLSRNCVGWVDGDQAYTLEGEFAGTLSRDSRIVKKRSDPRPPLRKGIPPAPPRPADLPGRSPLPPSFSDLSYSMIDVMEEDPDIFKRLSDRRPDMGE
jgi:hypothetical protein